jgi:hypothetical protein
MEGSQMSANLLLLWMSARTEGSWSQFRSAVEALRVGEGEGTASPEAGDESDQYALPIYQSVRLNMQRLGHAEFFAGAGGPDWRVAPPTLAIAAHPTGARGILAGARSDRLLARLQGSLGNARIEVLPTAEAPDAIRLLADEAIALEATAKAAGIFVQRDAPAAILQSLPTVGDPTIRRIAQFPVGVDWRIEHFDERTLGWSAVTRHAAGAAASGLFRFSFGHQRMCFWCRNGRAHAVPGQVGKYVALKKRRRHVLRYDDQANELQLPVPCRPPFLVERGLVACSGMLPKADASTGVLRYSDVPRAIAQLAAGLLEQELRK